MNRANGEGEKRKVTAVAPAARVAVSPVHNLNKSMEEQW